MLKLLPDYNPGDLEKLRCRINFRVIMDDTKGASLHHPEFIVLRELPCCALMVRCVGASYPHTSPCRAQHGNSQ
jgi:hypothetical protein